MTRRIAAVLASLLLAGSFIATAAPAEARDTGWDCPGCRNAR